MFYQDQYVTNNIAVGSDINITLVKTGSGIPKAIIPLGLIPASHWDSTLSFKGVNVDNKTISVRCNGSGSPQSFTIKYLILSTKA